MAMLAILRMTTGLRHTVGNGTTLRVGRLFMLTPTVRAGIRLNHRTS